MIDLYGSMGHIELLEEFFHNVISKEPNIQGYNMLIKAYGKCNLPDRAETIVRRMLHKDSTTKASMWTMNTMMNCWARVADREEVATERAFNIYYWMKNNQECINLQIKPDIVTFATLMKCVIGTASSKSTHYPKHSNRRHSINTDITDKVNIILEEMDERSRNGDKSFKPHVGIYSGGIKALLLANDYQRADDVLKILEEESDRHDDRKDENRRSQSASSVATSSDISNTTVIPFSIRSYVPFFKFFSRMRSTAGAQSAEKMHNRMRKFCLEKSNPALTPNHFTYNMILEAWVDSGDVNYVKYLWNIYEQMTKIDNITIGNDTYTILVDALSSSDGKRNRSRLLQLMQLFHIKKDNARDRKVYMIVIKNRIARGDVATVTKVMILLIDSYINLQFTWNTDRPDRAIFNWIISTHIESNELESTIFFLEDVIQRAAQAKYVTDGESLDVSWIGPSLNVMLDLRKAWTKNTKSIQKDYYIAKMDDVLIPAIVRLLNIDEGNIRQDMQSQPRERHQRQRR